MINNISSSIRAAANYLCPRQSKLAEIQVLQGASNRGAKKDAYRVSQEMRSGAFNEAIALNKLKAASVKPVDVGETWIILGFLDPGSRLLKTDLKHTLSQYVRDPSKIKQETNAMAAFKNLSIDDLALKFINRLQSTYEGAIKDAIHINIVGHSMGAAIATRAIMILSQLQLSKTYVVDSFISLNGAVQGAPLASAGSAVMRFKNKNVAHDLMRSNSENRCSRLARVRATYVSNSLDKVVPTYCAAPKGCPVVVLNTCRMTAHTDLLSHAVSVAYVLDKIKI